jgi:1-deoxy-D-xylulose-5-phosphate reductoisomerase
MKKLSILGSSGSIGKQTLDIIKRYPERFEVLGLSVNSSIDILREQIKEFNPKIVSVGSKKDAELLSKEFDIPVYYGIDGLVKVATFDKTDTIVNSVVGSIGVMPTLEAIRAKKNIALANKETLVTAGDIIMREIKKNNVLMTPIDSEHSAIFQALNGENKKEIKKIILTCSGGAFFGKKRDELKDVSAKQALKHPTWNMGGKITIDSATLMNKGFEVIEAHHIFGVSYDKIKVVIHPQSIIHSMVEFVDGSIIAQLGVHDMRIPILYALSYPERLELDIPKLDFSKLKELTFFEPDIETFKCLGYAYEAGRIGDSMPCVVNAANEVAVEYFLKGKIKFLDIEKVIRMTMDEHKVIKNPSIQDLIELDKKIKNELMEKLKLENKNT